MDAKERMQIVKEVIKELKKIGTLPGSPLEFVRKVETDVLREVKRIEAKSAWDIEKVDAELFELKTRLTDLEIKVLPK